MSSSDKILSARDKSMCSAQAISYEAHSYVLDAVQRRRGEGVKRAVAEVARRYGLGERRVVQYLRNQVKSPPAWELLTMRAKREEELRLWIIKSDAQAADARRKLQEFTS